MIIGATQMIQQAVYFASVGEVQRAEEWLEDAKSHVAFLTVRYHVRRYMRRLRTAEQFMKAGRVFVAIDRALLRPAQPARVPTPCPVRAANA
jgi:hypothetical protein